MCNVHSLILSTLLIYKYTFGTPVGLKMREEFLKHKHSEREREKEDKRRSHIKRAAKTKRKRNLFKEE